MKLDVLIFSKDRACQTELLIRSMMDKFHVPFNLTLQYTYSNDNFKKGYEKLHNKFKYICNFVKEDNLKKTFIDIVDKFENEYCMFLVDDNVFIHDVYQDKLEEMLTLYETIPNIHSLSLRMNESINYCFPAKKELETPEFIIKNSDRIMWDWTKCNKHYCWGYPMAIDSHIYKKKEILPIFKKIDFKNVNELESGINRNRFNKNLMLSFNQTKIYNIQANFVKEGSNEDVAVLNDMFLNNFQISTENIYGIHPNSAHGILEYKPFKVKYDESNVILKKKDFLIFYNYESKRDEEHVLFTYEPYSVNYFTWEVEDLKKFKKVITWNYKFFEKHKDEMNIVFYNGYPIFNRNMSEQLNVYVPFYDKKDVSLICKKRKSNMTCDMSEKRFEVFDNLSKHLITGYYGNGIHKNFKGFIGCKDTIEFLPSSTEKLKILNKYLFNICFENCYDEFWSYNYLTEKIFDCFRAKTIPIYYGCYNIEEIIPKELFIDYRQFSNDEELVSYLKTFDEIKYNDMVNRAFEFDKNCNWGSVNRWYKFISGE